MKFQDIPTHIVTVRVLPVESASGPLPEQAVWSVEARAHAPDLFDLRLADAMVAVRPVAVHDSRRLNLELASGMTMLARLVHPAADGSIELQIAFFQGQCLEMGEVEIGVDEYVESAMARLAGSGAPKGEELHRLLEERCCFLQEDSAFFFLTAGTAIDEALQPEAEARAGLAGPTRANSFRVSGHRLRFVVTENATTAGASVFLATRLTQSRSEPDRALRLARGRLRFADWTRTGTVQLLARAQMAALSQGAGGYLKKWDEFGDMEGELLLQQAREIGVLQFSDLAQQRDGTVSVRIGQASATALKALELGRVEELQLVDELPDYLDNASLRFKDFASAIEQAAESERAAGAPQQQAAPAYFRVADFDQDDMTLTLKTETLPCGAGMLILSLAGEIAQVKRRMAARRAILEGRAANPQLGLLIEEGGEIVPARSQPKVQALTAFVRDKVFLKAPTRKQEQAIHAALNTPDIALIQGPPGTGKTTVIAAILERLNELADQRGATIKGQVLLTGLQHDAVENMIDRLSLNSIPVPKFGKSSSAQQDDASAFDRKLEEWCGTLAAELRTRNPQIARVEQETDIDNLCLQYLRAPTRALAAHLAGKIAALGPAILGETEARRAAQLQRKLAREDALNEGGALWRDAVRRLRVRPVAFADDGPDRAGEALIDLRDMLEPAERDLLDRASLWGHADVAPPFLAELAALKEALLVRLTAPPVFRVDKQNDEVIELAELACQRIRTAGHTATDRKSAVLAEFLAELEGNPAGMVNAVADYSFAFAATCQQSVNRGMQIEKGLLAGNVDDNQKKMEYEYVIVDEAARVSPRDLMVPMAQGKRIILVGDHRQLPHIIDDEVARQMEAGEAGMAESDWLKKSIFEYLFSERLKALEERDGHPRRVTLDQQYRMHPVLGDFISRNFYERFDPQEKFGSGRPASEFVHNLPGAGAAPAAWLDVPAAKGRHQRSGTSWTRPAEATAIARQLRTWISSAQGKAMSYGVISFYKAQAELIRAQLQDLTGDGKKLRVGTVDSFQGMEFDVVFLSMVRTLPPGLKPGAKTRELQARALFGHLCLYNRLNVSMSRQKKLLVVVGDAGLLHNPLAAEFVPGLVDFHRLCLQQGVILPC